MLPVSFTREPVACLLLLRLRHIYRDTGDHRSMMGQGKIPFGVFRKVHLVRISDMLPMLGQRLDTVLLSQLSQ
jgi:hypothetical protein